MRITYHATVLAGVRVGRNGMVGAVGGRHQGRAALPRQRRHSGQVHPGQAQRTARGLRDRAGGAARAAGALAWLGRRERWYLSPSAIAAWALLASALVASALGGLPSVAHARRRARRRAHRPARRLAPRVGGPAPRRRGEPARRRRLARATSGSGGSRCSRCSPSRRASGWRSPAAAGAPARPRARPKPSPASSTAASASCSRSRS